MTHFLYALKTIFLPNLLYWIVIDWFFSLMAGEWCAAASGLGLDLNTFVPTVAYGIHFITLEDLRCLKNRAGHATTLP